MLDVTIVCCDVCVTIGGNVCWITAAEGKIIIECILNWVTPEGSRGDPPTIQRMSDVHGHVSAGGDVCESHSEVRTEISSRWECGLWKGGQGKRDWISKELMRWLTPKLVIKMVKPMAGELMMRYRSVLNCKSEMGIKDYSIDTQWMSLGLLGAYYKCYPHK